MPDLTGNSDAGNLPLRLLLSSLTGSVTLKVPETSQSLGWLTVPAARGGQLGNVAQVARGRAGPAVAPGDPADRAACRPGAERACQWKMNLPWQVQSLSISSAGPATARTRPAPGGAGQSGSGSALPARTVAAAPRTTACGGLTESTWMRRSPTGRLSTSMQPRAPAGARTVPFRVGNWPSDVPTRWGLPSSPVLPTSKPPIAEVETNPKEGHTMSLAQCPLFGSHPLRQA